jgi:putative ABC transport system permease protein
MRYRPQDYSIISLKLGNDPLNFISYAEQVWKKHDEIHEIDYILFDDQIREAYTGFDDIVKVTGFASFLAVFIAALGLLGMVIYTVETRAKEVGIRKVLGAKESDIAFILSRGFIKLLVIAVVIATPAAYLVNNMWLQSIPYHVNVSVTSIMFGIAIMAALGFLAIASQTYQAARANPIKALKDE